MMQSEFPDTVRIRAPAKINLFLQVRGKRPDGYHELVTLMCPVGLYDTLTLCFGARKTTVHCSHPEVPEDDTNLAHRAVDLFAHHMGCAIGVRVTIDKRIPVAAGLGGGSSDAAAVLMAMNRFYGNRFPQGRLMDMGARLGADVPFFIFQQPALATGIGERLTPCPPIAPYRVLLIDPGFCVSTASVFKKLNLALTNCEKVFKNLSFKNYTFDARRHLCNDLETVTASQHPEISAAKSVLLQHGALGAAMSGSGPTVFGLFADREAARLAHGRIGERHARWRLFLVDVLRHG